MIFKKPNERFLSAGKLKVLKIAAVTVVSIFTVCYLAFLFVLPNLININKFTPQIEAELKKQTKLGFEFVNPKLKTTWKFAVKITADKLALKYSDNTALVDIEKPSIEINLPTLLLKHLNLDKIYAKKINVLLVYDKDGKAGKYTVMDYIIEQPKPETPVAQEPLPVEIRNINIIVDSANMVLEDKTINRNFELKTTEKTQINLATLNGPVKVKTSGVIGMQGDNTNGIGEEFIDFDINLFVKLPKNMIAQEQKEPIKIEPFNPFENLYKFKFRSKVLVDLKINDLENFDAKGSAKISDITMTIGSNKLPQSYFNTDFKGSEITTDTNFYIAENEFLSAKSQIKTGKKPKIDVSAKSEKLSLNNIYRLFNAVLSVLNIDNEFSNIIANGVITCDFDVKSDMKKIQSKGNLELQNGSISYPKMNVNVTQIGSVLDFSNNKISIKNTSANLNGAKFTVSGTIAENSNLNIKINSDPMEINEIVKLGTGLKVIAEKDVADYIFHAGTITILADIKGNLKNILPKAEILIDKLSMTVKSLGLPLKIAKINVNAVPDKKDFKLDILVKGVSGGFIEPKLNLNIPQIKITGDSKTLTLPQFNANLEGSSGLISGVISDYATAPKLDFKASGSISPLTVLAFVPKNSRSLVKTAGKMPFSGTLTGGLTNLAVKGEVNSNPQNYVSVVDIDNLAGQNNKLNLNLNLVGDTVELNNISINSNVVTVKGKISNISAKNPTINALSITIPQKLNITAPAFGNAKFSVSSNGLQVSGTALSPMILGSLEIANLIYPQMNLRAQNANINFKNSAIAAAATGINIGKSDFAGDLTMSSNFSRVITIYDMKFNSANFDADELMKIMSSMPNTQTTAGPAVPIIIKAGKGVISKLKSGEMIVENINFDFDMANNLFKIKNMTSTVFGGTATGDIDYNVATLKTNVNLVGKNLNVKNATKSFNAAALPLSGTMNGMINAGFTGATYEQQMRTLNGLAKFDIKDGEMKNFIRFENFLYASNILSQNLLGFNLNSVVTAVTKVNTGEFKTLNSTINFANGWANIQEFKSSGPNMSLYAVGKYNLLTNIVDMIVMGRISPQVSSVLGPIGNLSIDKVLGKLPPKGLEILNAIKSIAPINPLIAKVNTSDLTKIPQLSTTTDNASTKEFQVVLNGAVTNVKIVKSFKWITDKDVSVPQTSTGATGLGAQGTGASATTPATTPAATGAKVQEVLKTILPPKPTTENGTAVPQTQSPSGVVPNLPAGVQKGLNILKSLPLD